LSQKAAQDQLVRIRAAAARADSFRGKTLSPGREECEFGESLATLRVTRIAPVARGEIILAPGLLDLVEQNTLGFAAQSDNLVRLGMSGQKGVLLYGPPGTGKTMLTRYLAGALAGYTKFFLSGDRVGWLSETIEAAHRLAPAMVVIEDVDLIGADRDGPFQSAPGALNRMLNEMDGAGPAARVLYLLTTNRPEVLERALAARPGRVDQAIEIGLPEELERCALLRRYSGELEIRDDTLTHVARRIGKVSPAFIKELVRRAAQMMLEDGGKALDARYFDRSLEAMTGPAGRITAKLLGAKGLGFTVQS
jgi:ATP-dependent 26S proteasome regulatory subunit